jgi:hypothetical protein
MHLPGVFTVSAIAFALCTGAVRAEDAQATTNRSGDLPVVVSCLLPPAKLADALVAAFLAKPKSLLDDSPKGGPAMIRRVRGLAASDSRTIDPLVGLNIDATVLQRIALGIGLNEAATACVAEHPEIAALIQMKVAGLGSGELFTAFEDASNDLAAAALATAQAPGIASGGGAPGSGSGGEHGDSLFPVSTGSFPISGGGGGGSTVIDVSPTTF